MANPYFTYTPLTANTNARAADVNTRFSGVETGFDLLPPPVYLYEDRITYSVDTGAANAYVATPAVPITAYNEGLRIHLKATNSNTGVSTLNVSGLGVKQVLRADGTALALNDIVAGQILDLTYDGTAFRLSLAFADISPAGVMTKIAAGGNMVVNGSATVSSLIQNGQTLDGLTAFGVSLAEAASAAASRTLLGLGTAATANTGDFVTSADISGKADKALSNVFTVSQTITQILNLKAADATSSATLQFRTSGGSVFEYIYAGHGSSRGISYTGDKHTFWNGAEAVTYLLLDNSAATFARDVIVPDEVYGAGWNASLEVPTKNAVYDKIETVIASIPSTAGLAPLASPALTGTPTAPTAAPGTNTTQLATTAFVTAATGAGGTAPIDSPTFTGDPKAPTPATGDNDTSIATTAFVKAQAYAPLASPALTGTPTAPTPAAANNTTALATTAFVQGELALYAPLANPALTGNPTAPTQAGGNSTTRLATTAFVQGELGGKAPALMTVTNFTAARTLSNAADLNGYLRFTGTVTRTITLGSGPTAGFSCILANRGTVALTLSAASGAYLNGAGATTASATLATAGKVTLVHEGSGIWTIDGTGAT